ncbi:MAG: tRNA uridine-5-carboxymethylaminomethyl(34) synthesis GTPase MnmE [Proteobacteria bacterium]|nr:tRNA uridine-5-carboxymethylaminomethyl(34) synthesis GTPase MnmE [Pseudomonadota bacterium]
MADTIFAPATAPGRAGIAVVRVSGPAAAAACQALTGKVPPPPRRAGLRRIVDPTTSEVLDDALVLWFAGPASETGEDVLELQLHGAPAVVAAVIEALGGLPGCRLANPGEFARRAFDNQKLDLTAVEGLADLIAAETAAQRRQAVRQMQGELGRLYEGWRAELVRLLARLEAAIDFSDEDLPADLAARAAAAIAPLVAAMTDHLAAGRAGERLRTGLSVAILGAPNVGKSSLLNALARREAAIVSARAGTTRDVIEVHLDLDGLPLALADTAGLRDSDDEIEQEGVRRALARTAAADVKLIVLDATAWPHIEPPVRALIDADAIVVVNKIDVATGPNPTVVDAQPVLAISARTGQGLDALTAALYARAEHALATGADPVPTRARHRAAVVEARDCLARAQGATLPELVTEDVRLAARAIGRITGRVDVEDVLDVIFREFCIGK